MATGTSPQDFSSAAERARWVRDNPDAPITCACGGNGTLSAWTVDPEITGHPYERHR